MDDIVSWLFEERCLAAMQPQALSYATYDNCIGLRTKLGCGSLECRAQGDGTRWTHEQG